MWAERRQSRPSERYWETEGLSAVGNMSLCVVRVRWWSLIWAVGPYIVQWTRRAALQFGRCRRYEAQLPRTHKSEAM